MLHIHPVEREVHLERLRELSRVNDHEERWDSEHRGREANRARKMPRRRRCHERAAVEPKWNHSKLPCLTGTHKRKRVTVWAGEVSVKLCRKCTVLIHPRTLDEIGINPEHLFAQETKRPANNALPLQDCINLFLSEQALCNEQFTDPRNSNVEGGGIHGG